MSFAQAVAALSVRVAGCVAQVCVAEHVNVWVCLSRVRAAGQAFLKAQSESGVDATTEFAEAKLDERAWRRVPARLSVVDRECLWLQ